MSKRRGLLQGLFVAMPSRSVIRFFLRTTTAIFVLGVCTYNHDKINRWIDNTSYHPAPIEHTPIDRKPLQNNQPKTDLGPAFEKIPRSASLFEGQIHTQRGAEAIKSSVYLLQTRTITDGDFTTERERKASGSVLKDLTDENDHRLILSARHILNTEQEAKDQSFTVYDSYGIKLGMAKVVNDAVSTKVTDGNTDTLLLKMISPNASYDAIPGLRIAHDLPSKQQEIILNQGEYGIDEGASGSPVLDHNNHIIGVIGSIQKNTGYPPILTESHLTFNPSNKDHSVFQSTHLMSNPKTPAYVSPLTEILPNTIQEDTKRGDTDLLIPGYPHDTPTLYIAHIITTHDINPVFSDIEPQKPVSDQQPQDSESLAGNPLLNNPESSHLILVKQEERVGLGTLIRNPQNPSSLLILTHLALATEDNKKPNIQGSFNLFSLKGTPLGRANCLDPDPNGQTVNLDQHSLLLAPEEPPVLAQNGLTPLSLAQTRPDHLISLIQDKDDRNGFAPDDDAAGSVVLDDHYDVIGLIDTSISKNQKMHNVYYNGESHSFLDKETPFWISPITNAISITPDTHFSETKTQHMTILGYDDSVPFAIHAHLSINTTVTQDRY